VNKYGNNLSQTILTHRFENGLSLVVEPMEWLESAAFCVLVPNGCQRDPTDRLGLSNFSCEMLQRGAGSRDSRQFVEALEKLGVERGSSVSNSHTSIAGAMPAKNIDDALGIFADLLRHPHLPADQLEEGRMVCFQEVRSIEDDLQQKTMMELRRRYYPDPFGRSCQGTVESIESISIDDIRQFFESTYGPTETILSVAGNVDWPRLRDRVGELFGDWQPREIPELTQTPAEGSYSHIAHESQQTQIALAFPSVPYSHDDYFQARGAVGVLSDGMSSRLFTEVREKRGLCYSVFATMHSLQDRGSVVCYAGTSTDRSQETLDVLIGELLRLPEGIEEDELTRLKAQVKSGLIMQQESSRSRAAAIALDWYHLNRVRTLDEISAIINGLSVDSITAYLADYPPRDMCIVTLGEKQLEVPGGVLPASA